jgi:heptosyltransferase-2
MALLARLRSFITNDSGLMHAAASLGTPTTAVFGSTHPRTTAPLGPWVRLVRKPVDCAPCLKQVCPRDMRCFTAIEPMDVVRAVRELKADSGGGA